MRRRASWVLLGLLVGCAAPRDPERVSCEEPALSVRRPGADWQFAPAGLPRQVTVPWLDPATLAGVFESIDELAARGQWDAAVVRLHELLEEPAPSQDPGERQPWLAVRAEASRRLRELPPPGQAEYQRLHGEAAGRLFERAERQLDPAGLVALLERYPGSALVPRAEELLIERHLEAGQADLALERIAARLFRTRDPAELARLERMRGLARAMQVIVPRVQLRSGEARIVVSTWAIEPGLDAQGTATLLGREQSERVLQAAGRRIRAEGPGRVATRPSWSIDVASADGLSRAQAVVYRPEDGTVFLFALECPAPEAPERAPAFRRLLKEARL